MLRTVIRSSVRFAVLVGIGYGVATMPPITDTDSAMARKGADRPIAYYAAREPNEEGSQARLHAAIITSALRYGILPGCPIVGGWEDGSVVAHCAATDTLITRGAGYGQRWQEYSGPIVPAWTDRMRCYDGQSGMHLDCGNDPIVQAYLVAGSVPVSDKQR